MLYSDIFVFILLFKNALFKHFPKKEMSTLPIEFPKFLSIDCKIIVTYIKKLISLFES